MNGLPPRNHEGRALAEKVFDAGVISAPHR